MNHVCMSNDKFEGVDELELWYCSTSDEEIKYLELRTLKISNCPNISGMYLGETLRVLYDDGNITDEDCDKLTNLVELRLTIRSKVTDNGLKKLINLKNLNLSNNETITDEGIKDLNLEILELNASSSLITQKCIDGFNLKFCDINE